MLPKSIRARFRSLLKPLSGLPVTIAFVMVAMPAAHGNIYFDNSAGTLDFGNALNWNLDLLPSFAGNGTSFIGGDQYVVFAGGMTTSGELQVGTDANPYGTSAGVPGGKATLTLNPGANLGIPSNLIVGQGPGTVDQSGIVELKPGAVMSLSSASARMFLGFYDGDAAGLTKGTLRLNGGTVNMNTGSGSIVVVGGRTDTPPNIYGRGVVEMNSGTMSIGSMVVGAGGGSGQITITGGVITASGYVTTASSPQGANGSGNWDMSGGTLNANSDFTIHESGATTASPGSTFNQTGGVVNLRGAAYIGRADGGFGKGTYNLKGTGTLNVSGADLLVCGGPLTQGTTSKGEMNISENGVLNFSGTLGWSIGTKPNTIATVTQSGGTVNLAPTSTNGLYLGGGSGLNPAGATATYTLAGGTLVTPAISTGTGASVKAFIFDGGQLVVNKTATMTVATSTTFTTTVNAGGAKIDTGANGVVWNPALLAGTGAGGLTKSGSGTLILQGANTYTGPLAILAGTVQLGNGTTGSSATTPLVFGGTGRFNCQSLTTGSAQTLGALTFAAGEGTVLSSYGTSGNSSLAFTSLVNRTPGATGNFITSLGSNGTTNLISFAAAPVAGTLLDRGYFFAGSSYASYDAAGFVRAYGAGDLNYVAAGGGSNTIATGASANVTLGGSVTAQAAATVNTLNLGSNSLTLDTGVDFQTDGVLQSGGTSSVISGGNSLSSATAGGELVVRTNSSSDAFSINTPLVDNTSATRLTTSGTGTLTLGAGNTYSGGTAVNSGTLKLGVPTALGSGAVTVAAGASLNLNGQPVSGNNALTLNTGSLTNGSAATATWPGLLTLGGSSSLIAGTGSLVLPNAGAITGSGFSLTLDGTGTSSSLAGAVATGTGSLTKTGTGAWTLSGINTYTGPTTINGGTLTLAGGAAIADSGAVVLANTAGVTLNLGASETIGSLAGGGTTGGNVGLGSFTLTTGGNNATTNFSGAISGTGAIVKTGTGVLTLGAANGYSGGTTLAGGVLSMGNAAALGTTGSVSFTGGTLQYGTGVTTDLSARIAAGTSAAPVAIDTNAQTITFATALTSAQSGGISVLGSGGTLKLTASNSYGGISRIAANSVLQVGASEVIPNSSVIVFEGNIRDAYGKLEVQNFTETVGGLSGSGGLIQNKETGGTGTGTLIVDTAGQNYTFNGTIRNMTGAVAIVKNGAGTQTILNSTVPAPNNFTGGITVNGGTLKLQDADSNSRVVSALSSDIAVASGATLALENTASIGATSTTARIISGAGAVEIGAGNVGTISLTGLNTYTGGTTVTSGTLLVNGNALPNAGKLVMNGGKVSIPASTNEVVGTLFYGSVQKLAGTYGSSTSSATNKDDTRFSGTGIITVTSSPPYETWIAGYPALTGGNALKTADPDSDGLINLVEYAFDTNPTTGVTSPIVANGGGITAHGTPAVSTTNGVDFSVTFGRRKDYLAAGLTYTVQFSANLTDWVDSTATPSAVSSDAVLDALNVPFPALISTPQGMRKPTFTRLKISGN